MYYSVIYGILILQDEEKTKYIDFAILNKGEKLILYQCKKAIAKIPENPITRTIIKNNDKIIKNRFRNSFKVSLKQIFIFYVTGINIYDQNGLIYYTTWGEKEGENLNKIEDLAKQANEELLYSETYFNPPTKCRKIR